MRGTAQIPAMPLSMTILAMLILAMMGLPGPAAAQTTLVACDTQQRLEQVISSEGQFMPEGCRDVTATRIESQVGEICVIRFPTEGITGAITGNEWWIRCDDLSAIE